MNKNKRALNVLLDGIEIKIGVVIMVTGLLSVLGFVIWAILYVMGG